MSFFGNVIDGITDPNSYPVIGTWWNAMHSGGGQSAPPSPQQAYAQAQQAQPAPVNGGGFTFNPQGAGSGAFPGQDPYAGDPNYNFTKFSPQTPLPNEGVLPKSGFGPQASGYVLSSATTPTTKGQDLQRLLIGSINDPDSTVELQQMLVRAGYLNPRARSFSSGQMSQGDATWYALERVMNDKITVGGDGTWHDLLMEKQAKGFRSKNWQTYLRQYGPDGSGQAAQTSYSTSTTHLSNQMDTEGYLNESFQRHLGRNANKAEIMAFKSALNKYEQDNPQVVNGSRDSSGSYVRQSTEAGGANPQQFAENFAQQGQYGDDADAHSLRTYMEMFQSALTGGH